MKQLILVLIGAILLVTICIAIPVSEGKYTNIKKVNKGYNNPNRVIKSTYDIKYNLYSVLYVENNDTVGLDHIYPIELDSLINDLNNNGKIY